MHQHASIIAVTRVVIKAYDMIRYDTCIYEKLRVVVDDSRDTCRPHRPIDLPTERMMLPQFILRVWEA